SYCLSLLACTLCSHNISHITNTACLVHVRRKFAEIVKVAGGDIKAEDVESVALEARRRIDTMFAIDSRFDDLDAENRRTERNIHLRPVMESFYTWAQSQLLTAVPRMPLYEALAYAVKYWPYVMNVLDDGLLELSNNIAERAIKPFVIGRKNFLFSDTPRGADASAGIYSIVTTAKMNGLNPRKYLEWLLTVMPNTEGLDDQSVIDEMMPWSKTLPVDLYLSEKAAKEASQMLDDPIVDIDPEVGRCLGGNGGAVAFVPIDHHVVTLARARFRPRVLICGVVFGVEQRVGGPRILPLRRDVERFLRYDRCGTGRHNQEKNKSFHVTFQSIRKQN
ncbi:MAG: transposase, partial [Bacteroidaceae bacterium]|nr:transposase [Bacteroidaceae bacterium]